MMVKCTAKSVMHDLHAKPPEVMFVNAIAQPIDTNTPMYLNVGTLKVVVTRKDSCNARNTLNMHTAATWMLDEINAAVALGNEVERQELARAPRPGAPWPRQTSRPSRRRLQQVIRAHLGEALPCKTLTHCTVRLSSCNRQGFKAMQQV